MFSKPNSNNTLYNTQNTTILIVLLLKDNQIVYLHPSSVIDGKPQWVIFEEFALTSKNYIRTVTTARGEWLVELAPHCFDLENFPECDAKDDLILEYKKLARRMGK